jgi:hypothetical protein
MLPIFSFLKGENQGFLSLQQGENLALHRQRLTPKAAGGIDIHLRLGHPALFELGDLRL